jgi:hypothetical protein
MDTRQRPRFDPLYQEQLRLVRGSEYEWNRKLGYASCDLQLDLQWQADENERSRPHGHSLPMQTA